MVEKRILREGSLDNEEREEIVEKLEKELEVRRVKHSLMVAKMARELAEKFGEDVELAERTGLLHDIAKEFSDERNREYVEKYGLDTELLKPEAKNYIHAEVGAMAAKEMGLSEMGVEAIRTHTIPEVGMNKMGKIIFLADKLGREDLPEELAKVREMAFEDLDWAMLKFLELQEKELKERGIKQKNKTRELVLKLRGDCGGSRGA